MKGLFMNKLIDLHIHTNCSDGILSSKEVVDVAKNNGVTTIAIADHDTVAAYTEDLFIYAKNKGIKIIPAVEISTKYRNGTIHILGYNIDYNNKILQERLLTLRNARHDYLNAVAYKLQSLGYVLDVSYLNKIDSVTKGDIANNIIENTANKDLLIKIFGHIPNKGEYIETIMNEGCPAYTKKETITPKEAADLIRLANGKVVLAHPVAYLYESNLTEDDITSIVKDINADGIEANYIYINRKNNNRINDSKKWCDYAKKYNLIGTIGSDFHSDDGISPLIGLPNELNIDEEYIIELLNKL